MRQTTLAMRAARDVTGRARTRPFARTVRLGGSPRIVGFIAAVIVLTGIFWPAQVSLRQLPNRRRVTSPTPTPAPPKVKKGGGKQPHHTVAAPAPKMPPLSDYEFFTLDVTPDGLVQRDSIRQSQGKSFTEDLGGGVSLEVVMIPAGNFMMGTGGGEAGQVKSEYARYCKTGDCGFYAAALVGAEQPQHKVSVAAFGISKWEVTQAQWDAVVKLPSVKVALRPTSLRPAMRARGGPDTPVAWVSWSEAVEFCERLSKKTGRKYRLPTEAEWEYACRAGNTTQFAFGDTINSHLVNYNGEFPYGQASTGVNRRAPRDVSVAKAANEFGLYDTHGNVMEWCLDVWHDNYQGAPAQAVAWEKGGDKAYRVARGGSWGDRGYECRSAFRHKHAAREQLPTIGFRVVVVVPPATKSA